MAGQDDQMNDHLHSAHDLQYHDAKDKGGRAGPENQRAPRMERAADPRMLVAKADERQQRDPDARLEISIQTD